MKKIGIFGGSFDPVHLGHVKIARLAKRKFGLDRVIFIPAGIRPHKVASAASPADRLSMVKLALGKEKGLSVSSYEVRRKSPSYTINTVRHWKRLLGKKAQVFFIIGADAFREIRTWKEWRQLLQLCDFIVVNRPGFRKRELPAGVKGNISFWRLPGIPISSTRVRELLQQGRPAKLLVSPAVYKYIQKKKLYQ
jgi:nicotinate-nucleotide adenylyltransferase